jgi:hypothetical protein
MVYIESLKQSLRHLQWELTLSYSAVTVGTLLTAVLILGLLLFSNILAPHELIGPEMWINIFDESVPSYWLRGFMWGLCPSRALPARALFRQLLLASWVC